MTTSLDVVATTGGPNPHPLPTTFSPSSLLKFRKCPLEWRNSYLPKIETPGSVATVKGNLFHSVMEDLWSAPATDRTLAHALDLVPARWNLVKEDPGTLWSLLSDDKWLADADHVQSLMDHEDPRVAEASAAAFMRALAGDHHAKAIDEQGLLAEVRTLLQNYFTLENPAQGSSTISPGGQVLPAVELEARSDFAGTTFRGYIDRVEENFDDDHSFVVTDYKTGKQKFDERYLEDYWWQQATYGVLLEDMFGIRTSQLRLVFPSGEGGGRQYSRGRVYVRNFDQAAASKHRLELEYTYRELLRCWETDTWPLVNPTKARLCDWCHFKDVCPSPGGYQS